jgi:4,5-dihydroxyphthalate decarboxylase
MAPVIVVLDDYPHTRALREATAGSDDLDCRYVRITPIFAAFARMVRQLEFDICELALATYLQAREAGIPLTLLPVVMSGDIQHHSLSRWPASAPVAPRELAGKRVGVRSYSQTSGMWVRGILREEFGIEAADVTWVPTEPCHVEQYREPRNVERGDGTVDNLLRDGQVAAAVLAPAAPGGPGADLVPVIRDAEAAGREWIDRHGTIPVNHLVVVRSDVLRQHQETVSRFYATVSRLAGDGKAVAGPLSPRRCAGERAVRHHRQPGRQRADARAGPAARRQRRAGGPRPAGGPRGRGRPRLAADRRCRHQRGERAERPVRLAGHLGQPAAPTIGPWVGRGSPRVSAASVRVPCTGLVAGEYR